MGVNSVGMCACVRACLRACVRTWVCVASVELVLLEEHNNYCLIKVELSPISFFLRWTNQGLKYLLKSCYPKYKGYWGRRTPQKDDANLPLYSASAL